MVLEVNGITKLYKNNRGVRDISFEIAEGEVFGLLGPNGAGKTTAMKVITGLVRAKSGHVRIFGSDVEGDTHNSLYYVGSLIEMPAFTPYMSAKKNLINAAKFYGQDAASPDTVLEAVGLSPYADEKVAKFSLGMKQRMGIALALIGNPRFLVLDEPANGLDIEGMVEIRNIIIALAKNKNTTFLISSHLSIEIEKTCDTVGIMYDSRLIAIEKMQYILENFPSLEDYFLSVVKAGRSAGVKDLSRHNQMDEENGVISR